MERKSNPMTLDDAIEASTFILNKDCGSMDREQKQLRDWLVELRTLRRCIKTPPRSTRNSREALLDVLRSIVGSGDIND